MISTAIKKAFKKGRERDWDRLYVAVDIHDTIVESNYSREELPQIFYPMAKETLQYLSQRDDIILILYTCSHQSELTRYMEFFDSHHIFFNSANENPHVVTSSQGLGNYEKKMYFDILLEDKAGFEAETDWKEVFDTLNKEKRLR